jgi:hypothetical protein
VQSWQHARFDGSGVTGWNVGTAAGLQGEHRYGPRSRLDDPILKHLNACLERSLDQEINAACAGRNDLHHEIGPGLNIGIPNDVQSLAGDEHQVRDHVVALVDVDTGVITHSTQTQRSDMHGNVMREIADDRLMPCAGSRCHKEFSIDQLVRLTPLALGHGVEIGDSECSWQRHTDSSYS